MTGWVRKVRGMIGMGRRRDVVSGAENGDLADRTVSVFQVKKDPNGKMDDVSAQYHYIEVAPQA